MKTTDHRPSNADYRLYEAFWEGFVDFRHGLQENPYRSAATRGAEAQLWDRGREAGRRIAEATRVV